MRFKVPKDVDIEDRVVGPLTIKQVAWIGSGFLLCIAVWQTADFQLFVFFALIIIPACLAFAFLRPYNQSLIAFCGSVLLFLTKPKQYLWRRPGYTFARSKTAGKNKGDVLIVTKKGFPEGNIKKLTQVIDSGGEKTGEN